MTQPDPNKPALEQPSPKQEPKNGPRSEPKPEQARRPDPSETGGQQTGNPNKPPQPNPRVNEGE
jgi:hypothetical protein